MHEVYQETLNKAVALHKEMRLDEAELLYHQVFNRLPFEEGVTYCLADLYLRKDYNGLAINLLSNLLQNNPKNANAWCNLGAAFRKENEYARAEAAWHKAVQAGGLTIELANNFATLYADRGNPQKALEWINRGLEIDPDSPQANWGKALALLSMGDQEGWNFYESRQRLDSWNPRHKIKAPRWDGSYVESLYVHGEQGVGDEVMFASALAYVKAKHVTVEVNPKVAPLILKSFPDFDVVTDEFDAEFDAKIPIGSLIGMFGPNKESYLNPDPWRVQFYREELKKLGPGPYIALTWHGGTKQTRCEDRSISLEMLRPLMDRYTCVSGQYDSGNPYVEKQRLDCGLAKINDESCGEDLHEQAALFKACDAVVTVQQTAVHVAGGVGVPTFAVIGHSPHWRYGLEGDSLPWYGSVKLYRRGKQEGWDQAIAKAIEAVDAHFGIVQRAEPAAA